jgi:hypothetical protein
MLPDGAVGKELVALDDDFAEGREIKRVEDLKAGR